MASVTVSSKYQMVIPKEARERFGIKPGQKLEVIIKGGVMHVVPVRELEELQGFIKGMNTDGLREKVDRV
jgi:AbrB family looped-hinge helix DNA binding protein